jgi:hypothetical protein
VQLENTEFQALTKQISLPFLKIGNQELMKGVNQIRAHRVDPWLKTFFETPKKPVALRG